MSPRLPHSPAHSKDMEPNDVTNTARQGFLTRTAQRADGRMSRLPEEPTGLGWCLRASRDLAVYGLCLIASDTITHFRHRSGRR